MLKEETSQIEFQFGFWISLVTSPWTQYTDHGNIKFVISVLAQKLDVQIL